jgi:hypothetical protein
MAALAMRKIVRRVSKRRADTNSSASNSGDFTDVAPEIRLSSDNGLLDSWAHNMAALAMRKIVRRVSKRDLHATHTLLVCKGLTMAGPP